jgi:nitrogenase-associated protein
VTRSVVFYEKPGCISNARQKALLRGHGIELSVKSLLTESWTAERLRPFFGTRPVRDWINPTAPRVKQGEVDPSVLDEPTALALMVADPLLIRRPLIEADCGCACGFEPGPLLSALGIDLDPEQDLQSCSQSGPAPRCEPPAEVEAP